MRVGLVGFLLAAFIGRLGFLKAFSSTLSGSSLTALKVSLAPSAVTRLAERGSANMKGVRRVGFTKLSMAAQSRFHFLPAGLLGEIGHLLLEGSAAQREVRRELL